MLILKDDQKVTLEIKPLSKKGNPAQVENVSWSVSSVDLLELIVDTENPLKATVEAVGGLGLAQVSVVADALIGEGTEEITGLLDLEVISSEAVIVDIIAGTPEEA